MHVIVKLQKTKTKQNLGEAREGKKSTYLFMNRDKNYSELLNRNQVKTVEKGVCQLKKNAHPKSWGLYFIWSIAKDYSQEAASQITEKLFQRGNGYRMEPGYTGVFFVLFCFVMFFNFLFCIRV